MRKVNVDEYPIVEVIWEDAVEEGGTGWNDIKEMMREAKKPCPVMHTVGYLVHKGEKHLAVLSTIGGNECSTLEKIPSGFLRSLTTLRESKPSKGTKRN
tara:strand:+ start:269 stop:565 length:297 start_codon:yes stop_codon:yes gene_type:complete